MLGKIILTLLLMLGGGGFFLMRKKNMSVWILSYVYHRIKIFFLKKIDKPKEIYFCIMDHFEPMWNKPSRRIERLRVERWAREYPQIAKQYKDCEGNHPKYVFFYPIEEYRYEHLRCLAEICKKDIADVEIHLHHDNDNSANLEKTLIDFKNKLYYEHRLLRKDDSGEILFGFIHGNWALDNSRKDGRWCGVNDEISVLERSGCFADFTMPSAPDETQTKKINSIYYAEDNTLLPKSHNDGIDAMVNRKIPDHSLLCVQGPLALNWKKKKWFFFPKIENGELSYDNPPTSERIDYWIEQNIHVKGAEDHIFVKVYTHGAQESNMDMLLGGGLDTIFTYLDKKYNDGDNFRLHYVTAWGIYNKIKELECNSF